MSAGSDSPVPSPSQRASNLRRTQLWAIAPALLALVVYLPSLRGQFVLDDWFLIVNSPIVRSLAHVPEAFTGSFLPEVFGKDVVYYRPLVTISYQLNSAVSGLNPFAFRLANIGLNALVAVLVFALTLRLTRSLFAATLAGVFFATTPSHAEAAAWISGRTDLLATAFVVSAMLVFARTGGRFSWRAGSACSLLFVCGLFSKENALVLPLLMAGWAWIFANGISRRDALRWAAVLLPGLILYLVLRKVFVGAAVDKHIFFLLGERLLGVGIAYATYLRMLFVPMEARVLYDVFPVGMKYPAVAVLAWLVPIGLVAIAVWAKKRAPVVALASLWMLLTLLPVSNILPTSGPLPAERFAYLASVGSSLVLGWCGWRLWMWQPKSLRIWKPMLAAVGAWLILYGGLLSISGSRHYSSNVAWARGVAETDTRFAMFRAQAGQYLEQAGFPEEAAREYRAALEEEPEEPARYIDLAEALIAAGKPHEAVEVLEQAQDRTGESYALHYARAMALAHTGDLRKAEDAFERATEMASKSPDGWRRLGRARLRLGDARGAVSAYEEALSLAPLPPSDRLDLGNAYRRLGEYRRARKQFELAAGQDADRDAAENAREALKSMRQEGAQ